MEGMPDHSRDGETKVGAIVAVLCIFSILTTAVVALRVVTRTKLLNSFGPDDAIIIAAQVLALGTAVAEGLETKYGLGKHTWLQSKEDFIPFMKSFYVSIILYNVALCLVKISILLQYYRLFTQRTTKIVSLAGLCFMIAWTTTLAFLLTLICWPVATFWGGAEGRCLDQLAVWYTMAGMSIVTDFTLFIIPLPVIRSLQLPDKQKLLLVFVFGLGLFTCIVSVLRIPTLHVASLTTDPNWDNTDAAVWSFVEVSTAIMTSSLPTLRPLLTTFMPRFFSSVSSSHRGPRSQYQGTYRLGSRDKRSALSSNTPHSPTWKDAVPGRRGAGEDDVELGLADLQPDVPPAYSVTVTRGQKSRDSDLSKPNGTRTVLVTTTSTAQISRPAHAVSR